MLALAPSQALAHDNLGGDELAMSSLMLIGAVVVAAMGGLALIWAAKAGQFKNVEESKYSMLETADDYDPLILESGQTPATQKRNGKGTVEDKGAAAGAIDRATSLDVGQQVGR